MKKTLSIILVTFMLVSSSIVASAISVGTVIGEALHTDIVAYINNHAIPSYAVKGQSVIVAEDLRNFGFNVVWDQNTRSLTISRNEAFNSTSAPMTVVKNEPTGTKYTDILATDIYVYAEGKKLTSYAMNGYTMIPIEELTMFGTVTWNADDRALYLESWVENKITKSEIFDELTNYILNNGTKQDWEPFKTEQYNIYVKPLPTDNTRGSRWCTLISFGMMNETIYMEYLNGGNERVLINLTVNKVPGFSYLYEPYDDAGSRKQLIVEYPYKNKAYVVKSSYNNPSLFQINQILTEMSKYLEENTGISFEDLGMVV